MIVSRRTRMKLNIS